MGSMTDQQRDFMGRIVVPMIVALLTGGFGAYVGVETALARYDERITRNEIEVQRITVELETRRQAQRDFERLSIRLDERLANVGDRLSRIEDRLDGGE